MKNRSQLSKIKNRNLVSKIKKSDFGGQIKNRTLVSQSGQQFPQLLLDITVEMVPVSKVSRARWCGLKCKRKSQCKCKKINFEKHYFIKTKFMSVVA